jgi:ABC-type proline/glycine betaine transport system ATPase subunit
MNQTNVLMEVRNVTKIFGGDGARALQMVNEGISKDEIQERTGAVVEYGETDKIFTNPDDKRTEDYVTGKVG